MTVRRKAESVSSTEHARTPIPDAEEMEQLDAAGGMVGGMEQGSASGLRQAYVDAKSGVPREKPTSKTKD